MEKAKYRERISSRYGEDFLDLLGKISDARIAKQFGTYADRVVRIRKAMGISAATENGGEDRRFGKWIQIRIENKDTEKTIAEKAVAAYRKSLGKAMA